MTGATVTGMVCGALARAVAGAREPPLHAAIATASRSPAAAKIKARVNCGLTLGIVFMRSCCSNEDENCPSYLFRHAFDVCASQISSAIYKILRSCRGWSHRGQGPLGEPYVGR